ncbi:MAG: lytic transglycosylase domain-containing protein [Acidobacteriia bacterium]|nr:lytic transglycosylase domain-containing protein [Terriglobia bacterium]
MTLVLPSWAADSSVQAKPSVAPVAYLALLRNGFSIRHQRSEARDGGVTRLYTSADDFVDVPTLEIASIEAEEALPQPPQSPPTGDVPRLLDLASDKHQVDADFIRSVIRAESGFNPRALSPKGAQGLMQLMPQTALKLGVQDPFEPGANIDAGTKYLRDLLLQYHGDVAKALAAYNAGPLRVAQYNGVPPYRETRAYIRRVINDYNRAKRSQPHKDQSSTAPKPGN